MMSNPMLSDGIDRVCNLYIEELTDDQLLEDYFCRTCGRSTDEHSRKRTYQDFELIDRHTIHINTFLNIATDFPTAIENSEGEYETIYDVDDTSTQITSNNEEIQNSQIEQQTSNESEGTCPAPWTNNQNVDEKNFSSLSKQEASNVLDKIWTKLQEEQLSTRTAELENSCLTLNDKTIRWNECIYSETRPPTGHSLWISMHGGGGCPAPVNDQQYQNQINLYNPSEGIWVVPRSPTDSWNQWHQEHIDPMFDRIIENYIMVHNINSNRVYILGYSAGGDGVYQLAPRMADRFAAAAMMAGHPNDASPLSLRNLPFAIFVGENDSDYNRNEVAYEWAQKLDALQETDPDAYHHYVNICADMGHWMCGRDAEALPWLAQWTRNPWPKKVVWVQDDVVHNRFYWILLPDTIKAEQGQTITAKVDEQTIHISTSESIRRLTLCLSDALLDLDQLISVYVEGYGQVFQGHALRTEYAIADSLRHRADPTSVATAYLELTW